MLLVIYKPMGLRRTASPCSWQAPLEGVIKINADASLIERGWVGLGIVARNHEGKVLFAATRRTKAFWPPEIAEAKALVLAAKLGRKYAFDDVILETDCQSLITRLSKGVIYLSDLDGVLGDILDLCSCFKSVNWTHVKRDGNCVAHHLAKLVPFGVEQVWENHCPTEIALYVLMDTLSLN